MSEVHQTPITCPQCHAEGTYEHWDSINVDLNPEMRAKVLNEEAFMWTCPKCGTKALVCHSTLYHDMKHKFMIYYDPEEPKDSSKKYDCTDWPIPHGIPEGYRFRFVYGHHNLTEKILLLESEYDDIAVEKLKYFITHHMDPSLATKGVKLIYAGIMKPTDEYKYGKLLFFCYIPGTDEKGNISIDAEKYYQQRLSIELDKRFHVDNWMCVDEGWVSMKMKGVE